MYGTKTFDAKAGTVLSLARQVPHAWGNPTDTPIRLMITATPGGCEEALRMIAKGGDQPNLQAIAEKFAVTVVGPALFVSLYEPGCEPGDKRKRGTTD